MRIVKPQQLALIQNRYQTGNQCQLGVSVVAGFHLTNPSQLITEAEIWSAWQTAENSVSGLDFAQSKPLAEYLITGHCHLAAGAQEKIISIKVGQFCRQWRVRRSDPTSVEEPCCVPLTHAQAPVNANNPLGLAKDLAQLLPYDEDNAGITAPAPVPQDYALRQRHIEQAMSQLSPEEYRKTIFPGFPPALDEHYFQLAPPQQWAHNRHWPETVMYELQGFERDNKRVKGMIPAVTGRAFAQSLTSSLTEVALERKTLWFLLDSSIGLVIFTGSIALNHLLEQPFAALTIALDNAQGMRSLEHYRHVIHRRTSEKASPFEFLYDPDLMPEGASLSTIDTVSRHPGSARYDGNAQSTAPAFYQRVREAIALHNSHDLNAPIPSCPLPHFRCDPEWASLPPGSQTLENEIFRAVMFPASVAHKVFRQCQFSHCDFSGIYFDDCQFFSCTFSHVRFFGAVLNNTIMEHCNLNCCTFEQSSFNEFKGDFITCEAVQAMDLCIENSTLKNSLFPECDFSRLRLSESELNNCVFNRSSIHSAYFTKSALCQCIMNACNARRVRIENSQLEKNSITGGDWYALNIEQCQISCLTVGDKADLSELNMVDCIISKTGMTAVNLPYCKLIRCTASEFSLEKANVNAGVIIACELTRINLRESMLIDSCWQKSSLQQGILYGADLQGAIIEECNLVSANLAMIKQNSTTTFLKCLLDKVSWLPERQRDSGGVK